MLVRLATSLDPSRVRPVVVCLREPGPWAGPLIARGIAVHRHLLGYKYDFAAVRRLSRLLRDYRPACIMAVGSGGDRMFWSTLAACIARSPIVVWSHLFPVPGQPEFEWINRRLYRWVDAFVALGWRHAEALAEAAGIPRGRIHVIRNGIDLDSVDHPEWREEARQLLGLSPGEVAVGMVANLKPIKRVEMFIDAATQVVAARPVARFFVIGEGPQRGELESRIARAGPTGARIALLGVRDDVPQLLHAFDVVCLTSLRECLSVAMLEAMAAGKPVVAPRVGSLDEALADGQTGRFFDPATPEALAQVLVALVDDPILRSRLGQAGRDRVRADFQLEKMAWAFEDLVTSLCARIA